MSSPIPPSPYAIVELRLFPELEEASRLYRSVFEYTGPESGLNPRLLRAIAMHGGCVIGARLPSGRLVGFGYGFPGSSNGESYLYSQAVVVSPEVQGTGVGRRIKAAQRRVALGQGFHAMRWSFDPLYARNAHVNLDVLGAVGRWFEYDYYGDSDSDRIVVEWDLAERSNTVPARPRPEPWHKYERSDWGIVDRRGDLAAIPTPADVHVSAVARDSVASGLKNLFPQLLREGFEVVSCCAQSKGTAVYMLERSLPKGGNIR
jgi:predicted GNAT superfamily acetyltransferase